uniref:Integrase core domain-containing protein n=1 Tax=Amphimedon queenslandica TaxID=400682 RepID=A0A1X7T7Y3_AMPQE
MMKGCLASSLDIDVGEHQIASSLQRVDPEGYEIHKSDTVDRANPIPYLAQYFGHKLHLDQNEKLIRYGVTHVIAVDGFSAKIVAHTSMPIKSNLTIYLKGYREAVLQYGLRHQLRFDHGREFYLSLYVQN